MLVIASNTSNEGIFIFYMSTHRRPTAPAASPHVAARQAPPVVPLSARITATTREHTPNTPGTTRTQKASANHKRPTKDRQKKVAPCLANVDSICPPPLRAIYVDNRREVVIAMELTTLIPILCAIRIDPRGQITIAMEPTTSIPALPTIRKNDRGQIAITMTLTMLVPPLCAIYKCNRGQITIAMDSTVLIPVLCAICIDNRGQITIAMDSTVLIPVLCAICIDNCRQITIAMTPTAQMPFHVVVTCVRYREPIDHIVSPQHKQCIQSRASAH
jgi:hypothetical protein